MAAATCFLTEHDIGTGNRFLRIFIEFPCDLCEAVSNLPNEILKEELIYF